MHWYSSSECKIDRYEAPGFVMIAENLTLTSFVLTIENISSHPHPFRYSQYVTRTESDHVISSHPLPSESSISLSLPQCLLSSHSPIFPPPQTLPPPPLHPSHPIPNPHNIPPQARPPHRSRSSRPQQVRSLQRQGRDRIPRRWRGSDLLLPAGEGKAGEAAGGGAG